MKFFLFLFCFVCVGLLCTGCSHNINVQGVGIATPYFAMGYGTLTCAKENVSVESEETVGKEGAVSTKNKFTVGNQITGAYVDSLKAGATPEKLDAHLSKK